MINAEDMNVAKAIYTEIPRIATVVDNCAERCKKGGHIFYIGAGTSGRIGILDASECPPTYGNVAGCGHMLRSVKVKHDLNQ